MASYFQEGTGQVVRADRSSKSNIGHLEETSFTQATMNQGDQEVYEDNSRAVTYDKQTSELTHYRIKTPWESGLSTLGQNTGSAAIDSTVLTGAAVIPQCRGSSNYINSQPFYPILKPSSGDISGSHIVTSDAASSTLLRLHTYNLGLNRRFERTGGDDGGLSLVSIPSQYIVPGLGGSSYGWVYPRVNDQGLVAFVAKDTSNSNEIQLLVCSVASCASTLQIIDRISYVFPLPRGQFTFHDINNNKLVYAKNDFSAGTSSIISYDLASGQRQTLVQIPYSGNINNLDMFLEAYIDNSGNVIYSRVRGILGQDVLSYYFIPANSNTPLFFASVPNFCPSGFPCVGAALSLTSLGMPQTTLIFNLLVENSGTHWDLEYRTYSNGQLSQPTTLIPNNDGQHQLLPLLTYHPSLQAPFLAYSVPTSSSLYAEFEYIQTATYNPQTNTFVPYKSIFPPTPFLTHSTMGTQVDGFNILSQAYDRNSQTTQLYITEC